MACGQNLLLTHAFRILQSSSDMYASCLMSDACWPANFVFSVFCVWSGSSSFLTTFLDTSSWAHRWRFVNAMGGLLSWAANMREDGIRNGRAPVGEAWLFEGTIENWMPKNFKYAWRTWVGQHLSTLTVHPDIYLPTCHFRQPGLNDGNSSFAEFSSVKI